MPSRSLLKINEEVYTNPDSNITFGYFGLLEELWHGKHAKSGHERNIRQLERDSHDSLVRLINGQENIKAAKATIVQNELACAHIFKEAKEFVETLDQYSVIAAANEVVTADGRKYGDLDQFKEYLKTELPALNATQGTDAMLSNEEFAALAKTFGEHEFPHRDTVDEKLYTQLNQLENQFGTGLVPYSAGVLALNIPLVDMSEPPQTRTETLLDITFQDRFDHIFTTLMEEMERPSALRSEVQLSWNESTAAFESDEEFNQAFNNLFDHLINTLEIDATLPETGEGTFPLLDLPFQDTPDQYERLNHVSQIVDPTPSPISNAYYDLWEAFGTFGCVIWCSPDGKPKEFIPNIFIESTSVGNKSYYQLFVENYAAMDILHQLEIQSLKGETMPLHCPLCQNEYDPCSDTWTQHVESDIWPVIDPDNWEDYLAKTTPVLEDFVATEVPGEERLAAYRVAR